MSQPTKKISALPVSAALSDADYAPLVQSGTTKRGLLSAFWTYIQSKLGAYWYSSTGTGGSDGNGGQPPAPKNLIRCTVKNSLAIGQKYIEDSGPGTQYVPNCGGTVEMTILTAGVTNGDGYNQQIYAASGQNYGGLTGTGRVQWYRTN